MTSIIKIYIYEVLHKISSNNSNIKYKFNKLKKSDNKKYNSITPNKINIKNTIDTNYFFSKNTIKNNNNKNTSKNNISMEELLKQKNLQNLYKKFYLKYSTRITLNNFKTYNLSYTNNINQIITDANNIFIEYLKKIKPNYNIQLLENDSEIIYKIKAENNEKIIVMGDNHGSFHSVFRIFLRLYFSGIIGKDYKLQDGYRIILLGDVIDRGNFGIEIMYIFFKLITANNTKDNLKVILIRGNHEEKNTFSRYGFSNEIEKKFPNNSSTIIELFTKFYKYCPSAIILKHSNTTYWLCHGGFSLDLINSNSESLELYKKIYEENKTNVLLTLDNNKLQKMKQNNKNTISIKELENNILNINEKLLEHIYTIMTNNTNIENLTNRLNELLNNYNNTFNKYNKIQSNYGNILNKLNPQIEELENQIEELENQIKTLENQKEELKKKKEELENQIKTLEKKKEELKNKVKNYSIVSSFIPFTNELDKDLFISNKKIDNLNYSHIRWNDFISSTDTLPSNRGNFNIYTIGIDDLQKFLIINEIDFIIRGHTDNLSNAMLLGNGFNEKLQYDDSRQDFYFINNIINKKKYDENISSGVIQYPEYTTVNNKIKVENEVATIYPKKFNKNEVKINDNASLYPVLTISNNSDIQRNLYPDSYIIIERI